MSFGWLLESEYESGYVLREDELDHSPYDATRNIFHAILHARPTDSGHGAMVRYSLVGTEMRYDIDWTKLPDNARPIYYRKMQRHAVNGDFAGEPEVLGHFFGYQFTDATGANVEEIKEIL